jgi:hypothetical protein
MEVSTAETYVVHDVSYLMYGELNATTAVLGAMAGRLRYEVAAPQPSGKRNSVLLALLLEPCR